MTIQRLSNGKWTLKEMCGDGGERMERIRCVSIIQKQAPNEYRSWMLALLCHWHHMHCINDWISFQSSLSLFLSSHPLPPRPSSPLFYQLLQLPKGKPYSMDWCANGILQEYNSQFAYNYYAIESWVDDFVVIADTMEKVHSTTCSTRVRGRVRA